MKKYILVASIILLLPFLVFSASAQHNHAEQQQNASQQMSSMEGGMMSMMHDMMGTMMNDPFKRSGMMIHVIPSMKEALDLTDEQLTGLQETKSIYKSGLMALEDKAKKSEKELRELLQSEEADPAVVKTIMLETAEHRISMKTLTYETASNMRSQLTEEQRASLAEMKPMKLHHHMMTKMTMMEMMQAMHGEGMMGKEGRGMMQGQMSMGMNK